MFLNLHPLLIDEHHRIVVQIDVVDSRAVDPTVCYARIPLEWVGSSRTAPSCPACEIHHVQADGSTIVWSLQAAVIRVLPSGQRVLPP